MPKTRFYNIKGLLWTYLVWTCLNLWYAAALHKALGSDPPGIPYIWAALQILPLCALREGSASGLAILGLWGVIGGALVISGLFMKERWACVFIILGMSLWFLASWLLAGVSV